MTSWGDPIRHERGSRTGVLLCHGFTGSPASLADWAGYLADAGLDVRVPRLPGHGTHWRELNRTGWQDWYARVERQLLEMSEHHDRVVVGGLSMGGALALRLAQQLPGHVAGLMLVNPAVLMTDRRLRALPLLRHLVPSIAGLTSDIARPGVVESGYDRTPLHALASALQLFALTLAELPEVQAPLLMFRSVTDHVVPPLSGRTVLERVGSQDVTDVELHRSYHVATMDHDAELIFSESLAFVRRLAPEVEV